MIESFMLVFFGELNIPSESTFRNSKRNIENRAYQTVRKSTQLAVNLRCMQLKDNKSNSLQWRRDYKRL